MSFDDVFHFLGTLGSISLIEVDVPDNEWFVIGKILNSGILQVEILIIFFNHLSKLSNHCL